MFRLTGLDIADPAGPRQTQSRLFLLDEMTASHLGRCIRFVVLLQFDGCVSTAIVGIEVNQLHVVVPTVQIKGIRNLLKEVSTLHFGGIVGLDQCMM